MIGVAGYERYGADILLRFVTIAHEKRSAGVGARLAANRLAHAAAARCTTAWLLTDTAADYWAPHGFARIERTAAPPDISRSREWSAACRASAIAMQRELRIGVLSAESTG